MTSTDTRDVMSTIRQIKELEEVDCELVRVAVPDMEAVQAIGEIKRGISIPLVADIHFDHRLALAVRRAVPNGRRDRGVLLPAVDRPAACSGQAVSARGRRARADTLCHLDEAQAV